MTKYKLTAAIDLRPDAKYCINLSITDGKNSDTAVGLSATPADQAAQMASNLIRSFVTKYPPTKKKEGK